LGDILSFRLLLSAAFSSSFSPFLCQLHLHSHPRSAEDLDLVLDSVYALKTLYVFCPLDASCSASAFPPPEHFYEHNVRTFSVHHVALEYYGKAMREHADGAFQVL
jgi:hypothetical protein